MGAVGLVARVNGLDERQARFVELIAGGVEPEEAKGRAGYAESVPTVGILRGKLVQNAISELCDARLRGELRLKALKTLDELLDSKSAQVKLGAVKLVLEQASQAEEAESEKALDAMGREELEALAHRLEEEQRARMRDVTPKNGA